jgi:hypothetical protein
MALGDGIHTTYYDGVSWSVADREKVNKDMFEKLFKTSPFVNKGYDKSVVLDTARKYMFGHKSGYVQGVPASGGVNAMFPNGVNMAFQGVGDIAKDVVHKVAGDPANAYVPDVRSPGANEDGSVNITPQDSDPKIEFKDIKPNYQVGTDGTRDPANTGKSIHDAIIGATQEQQVTLKLGAAFAGEWKS